MPLYIYKYIYIDKKLPNTYVILSINVISQIPSMRCGLIIINTLIVGILIKSEC